MPRHAIEGIERQAQAPQHGLDLLIGDKMHEAEVYNPLLSHYRNDDIARRAIAMTSVNRSAEMGSSLCQIVVGLALFILLSSGPVSVNAQTLEDAVEAIASTLAGHAKENDSENLAIVGFSELNGFESAMTDLLAEELVTAFFGQGSFNVVERSQLQRVLSEFELYGNDLFDKDKIARLQKLLGVDAIVTGTVARLGESLRVNARIVDMETARVFGAASATVAVDDVIEGLLVQRSAQSGTKSRSGGAQQPTDVLFRNDYISVVPNVVTLKDNRQAIQIAAEVSNLTDDVITLWAGRKSYDRSAISDAGSVVSLRRPDGLAISGDGTRIAPGGSIQISWSGRGPYREEISGAILNLRENLHVQAEQRRFTIQVNLERIRIE